MFKIDHKCKGVKMEKERKFPVNICLSQTVIDKVDAKRGNVPRSEFLRNIILSNLSKIKAV